MEESINTTGNKPVNFQEEKRKQLKLMKEEIEWLRVVTELSELRIKAGSFMQQITSKIQEAIFEAAVVLNLGETEKKVLFEHFGMTVEEPVVPKMEVLKDEPKELTEEGC